MQIVSKDGNGYRAEIYTRAMMIRGRMGQKLVALSPKYPSRFAASMHAWQSTDFERAQKITSAT